MKKVIAVFAAALMLLLILPASAVHQPDNTEAVWQNGEELVACFDTIIFRLPDRDETMMERYGVSDGGAGRIVSAYPITITNEEALICRGWAGIRSGALITQYGYRINGGVPVFSEQFKTGCEDAVIAAGGDSRFHVIIPVKGFTEPTLITVTCMGNDGRIYDILEFSVNGLYLTEDYKPESPFVRKYGEVEAGKLNVVIDGGTEPKKAIAGEQVTVNVELKNCASLRNAALVISYDPDLSLKSTAFPIKSGSDTATATVNAKTHTVTLNWSSNKSASGDKTFATLTFDLAKDLHDGDFLHVTAESFSGASSYNIINGGIEIGFEVGDVTGDGFVNNKDVVALFRFCSGDGKYNAASTNVCDINRDKSVNNKDVVKLFRVSSNNDEITVGEYIPTVYSETTNRIMNARSWTFNDGFAGTVIGVYCETEPDCEVIVCDYEGNVLLRENTIDRYFYGRYILPDGQSSETAYIYARAAGKNWSSTSGPVHLEYGSAGANAMIAHDSHVFYNQYVAHYNGSAALGGNAADRLTQVKNYLNAQLKQIRAKTGKNTKIIIAVCTNPATVYHEVQYTEEEGGWGDKYTPTSYTQFAEFMKNENDIYVLDMRDLFEQNKDKRLLFMQADSHWTSVAAYYAYYRAAQKVQKDFPQTKVYDLDKDFNVTVYGGGGDLLGFMGAHGVAAATTSVEWKSESMRAPANAPTAYVMGDSYYWAMSGYLGLIFSEVYLNSPASNPPLYDYSLIDLQTKKPDYLLYIWTERNIDTNLGMIINCISAGNMR